MKDPSKERGCGGGVNLGRNTRAFAYAGKLKIKHGKEYGVYRCPHCGGTHLTTKLHKKDEYKELLYSTVDNIQN